VESGGLVARLSHATGKPPGVRHLAASLEWWRTFAEHEKMELNKLGAKVAQATMVHGNWKVQREVSSDEEWSASTFLGGYGELFVEYNLTRRFRVIPNYLCAEHLDGARHDPNGVTQVPPAPNLSLPQAQLIFHGRVAQVVRQLNKLQGITFILANS
ncbi:MAG: hypothetical protein SGPRY_005502, partial [Prymnesium sp.]